MSQLAGKEPAHWHTPEGKHNMTDPRTIDGWTTVHMDADEKAYLAHLRAHESVERREGDSEAVSAIFELIEAHEREDKKLKELIQALRQQGS